MHKERKKIMFSLLMTFFLLFVGKDAFAATSTVTTDHEFTVKLSQAITQQEVEKNIQLTCNCEHQPRYELFLTKNNKSVKIVSLDGLDSRYTYKVQVSDQLENAKGIKVKAGAEQSFTVSATNKQTMQMSKKLSEYTKTLYSERVENIQLYNTGNGTPSSMQGVWSAMFGKSTFIDEHFPLIKSSNKVANVVLLWTNADIVALQNKIGQFRLNTYNKEHQAIIVYGPSIIAADFYEQFFLWAMDTIYEAQLPEYLAVTFAQVYSTGIAKYKEDTKELQGFGPNMRASAINALQSNSVMNLKVAESNELKLALAFLIDDNAISSLNDLAIRTKYVNSQLAWDSTFNESISNLEKYYTKGLAYYGENNIKTLLAGYKKYKSENITIYGANSVSQQHIDEIGKDFDTSMKPYFNELFPATVRMKNKPTVVILGTDEEEARYIKAGGSVGPIWAGGWYTSGGNIAMRDDGSIDVLAHEYMHMVVWEAYGKGSMPDWLGEAFADLVADMYLDKVNNPIQSQRIQDRFNVLSGKYDVNELYVEYSDESIGALAMLWHEFGYDGIINYLTGGENSFSKTFNMPYEELEDYVEKAANYIRDVQLPNYLNGLKLTDSKNATIYSTASIQQSEIQAVNAQIEQLYEKLYKKIYSRVVKSEEKPTIVMYRTEQEREGIEAKLNSSLYNNIDYINSIDILFVDVEGISNVSEFSSGYHDWIMDQLYAANMPSQFMTFIEENVVDMYTENVVSILQTASVKESLAQLLRSLDEQAMTSYRSNEFITAMAMVLEQFGVESIDKLLLAQESKTFEQAWQQVYGFNYDDLIQYTYKAKDYYLQQISDKGRPVNLLEQYNAASSYKPIFSEAYLFELDIFGKYEIYETSMYRLYASPTVAAQFVEQFRVFGNGEFNSKLGQSINQRPIFVLMTNSERDYWQQHYLGIGYDFSFGNRLFIFNTDFLNDFESITQNMYNSYDIYNRQLTQ